MRFIHTGDWHIGRTLHGVSLLEDQAFVLDRLVDLIAEEQPDALVVAGDVYDRAVPPADAVALLDRTLDRVVRELGVPVIMVAGNHDSADRIGFASHLLGESGLHVAGRVGPDPVSVEIGTDEPVRFWLLPYADPITTRGAIPGCDVHTHDEAVRAVLACCADDDSMPRVLVTHHFVAGSITSESERPLSVGGTGAVDVSALTGFDYVALGHIHRPQRAGSDAIRYAGSLLTYSFDEAGQTKSVTLVEVAEGSIRVEERVLPTLRAVRRIKGAFDSVLKAGLADPNRDDYIEVLLTDDVVPPDALARVREVYPRMLRIVRDMDVFTAEPDDASERAAAVETLPDDVLFERFFEYVTDTELDADQRAVLSELLDERERAGREAR